MRTDAWLSWTLLFACGGALLVDLQIVSLRTHLQPGALLWASRNRLLRDKGQLLLALLWTRIVLYPFLLLPTSSFVRTVALTGVVVTSIPVLTRRYLGSNGSDNVLSLIFLSLFLAQLSGAPHAHRLTAAFFAALLSLIYFTSSVAKAIGPAWRNGDALQQICSTKTFGRQRVHLMLRGKRHRARTLSWIVIAAEAVFALAPWMPWKVCLGILAVAFCFHVVNALIMGLNTFVFAFAALYPSALVTAYTLHHGF